VGTVPVHKNTVIVIVGPTAIGKTALSLALAQEFHTEIISADSRQCYRELNIGVAKPSPQELALVKHYFINSHSISETVNAAVFEQYALQAAHTIFQHHSVGIMVGGSGMYIKAFCEGLDAIPPIPQSIRLQIVNNYKQYGIEYLQKTLKEKDPSFWEKAEQKNPHRLIRALEVLEATGKSITAFQTGGKAERHFSIIKIGLQLPKNLLHDRINYRVDAMMEEGLLNEVKNLIPYRHFPALQTVGYTELFDCLDGKCELPEAVNAIKKHTQQYAKRQITWFKKTSAITWFQANNNNLITEIIAFLKNNFPSLPFTT
jgi:tRNA dimethylallyltransferase